MGSGLGQGVRRVGLAAAAGPARRWALLVLASLALAALLAWAGFPAALLLGPMLAAIGFGLAGASLRVPRVAFIGAQGIVGCLIARAITSSILVSIGRDWLLMLLVVLSTVAAAGAVGWTLMRLKVLPGTTAAWGSSPGAASAMVAMADEFGADTRLVAFMQYLRVIMVVLGASLVSRLLLGQGSAAPGPGLLHPFPGTPLLPLLETLLLAVAGAALGRRLRIPAGGLLVPAGVGAVLHASGAMTIALPPWLLSIAYAALGWYVGLAFDRSVLKEALRAVPLLLVSITALISLCGLAAWALTRLLGTDPLTAYLATTPGGADSITIIAVGSNADIPFVLAMQTLRLVVVVLLAPPLARLIARYG